MNELYETCLKLVKKNAKTTNEELQEMLAISILSIYLFDEKLVLEKIPQILQKLDIYVEDKTVLEIAHERLGNYQEDEELKKSDACVTRTLKIDEENGLAEEHKTLLVSLKDLKNKKVAIINVMIHELFHLIRFGGIKETNKSITITDGIATNKIYKETQKLLRKNYSLEEAVVQQATNETFEILKQELKKDNELKEPLKSIKPELRNYENTSYQLEVTILSMLSRSDKFRSLIKESFYNEDAPKDLAACFNKVMTNYSFMDLNRDLDELKEKATNEQTAQQAMIILNRLRNKIQEFVLKSNLNGKVFIKFPF